MTAWNARELSTIGDADELQIAPRRRDGTLRTPVTVWVVRHGDDLYVRSYRGPAGSWYRGTHARHQGHIRAGGIDKDVSFVAETDADANERIDAGYRRKYRHHGAQYVSPMVAEPARATTIKLVPR